MEGLSRVRKDVAQSSIAEAFETMQDVNISDLTVDCGPQNCTGLRYVELSFISHTGRTAESVSGLLIRQKVASGE